MLVNVQVMELSTVMFMETVSVEKALRVPSATYVKVVFPKMMLECVLVRFILSFSNLSKKSVYFFSM